MILTGEKLEEMGRAIWGREWPSVLADRLDRARQTLFNWRDRPTGLPANIRRELLTIAEDQLITTAKWVDELKNSLGMLD